MSSEYTLSTAQTDLCLRFRTFERLCLYGQMSSHTEFQLHIMF